MKFSYSLTETYKNIVKNIFVLSTTKIARMGFLSRRFSPIPSLNVPEEIIMDHEKIM